MEHYPVRSNRHLRTILIMGEKLKLKSHIRDEMTNPKIKRLRISPYTTYLTKQNSEVSSDATLISNEILICHLIPTAGDEK